MAVHGGGNDIDVTVGEIPLALDNAASDTKVNVLGTENADAVGVCQLDHHLADDRENRRGVDGLAGQHDVELGGDVGQKRVDEMHELPAPGARYEGKLDTVVPEPRLEAGHKGSGDIDLPVSDVAFDLRSCLQRNKLVHVQNGGAPVDEYVRQRDQPQDVVVEIAEEHPDVLAAAVRELVLVDRIEYVQRWQGRATPELDHIEVPAASQNVLHRLQLVQFGDHVKRTFPTLQPALIDTALQVFSGLSDQYAEFLVFPLAKPLVLHHQLVSHIE